MSLCFSFPSVKRGIAVANLVRIQLRNASTMPSAAWPGVRCQQMLGATALSHAREEQEVQSCKPDPTAALSGRKPQGWGKET